MKWEAMTPFYASGLLILLSIVKKASRIKSKKQIFSLLDGVGKILVETAGIIVPLGLIISGLTITGMAAAFTSGIISLSQGIPLLALLFGAGACFIFRDGWTLSSGLLSFGSDSGSLLSYDGV